MISIKIIVLGIFYIFLNIKFYSDIRQRFLLKQIDGLVKRPFKENVNNRNSIYFLDVRYKKILSFEIDLIINEMFAFRIKAIP